MEVPTRSNFNLLYTAFEKWQPFFDIFFLFLSKAEMKKKKRSLISINGPFDRCLPQVRGSHKSYREPASGNG